MQDTIQWLAETGDIANHYLKAIQLHIGRMASVNIDLRADLVRERSRVAWLRAAIESHVTTGHDQGGQLAAALAADAPGNAGEGQPMLTIEPRTTPGMCAYWRRFLAANPGLAAAQIYAPELLRLCDDADVLAGALAEIERLRAVLVKAARLLTDVEDSLDPTDWALYRLCRHLCAALSLDGGEGAGG